MRCCCSKRNAAERKSTYASPAACKVAYERTSCGKERNNMMVKSLVWISRPTLDTPTGKVSIILRNLDSPTSICRMVSVTCVTPCDALYVFPRNSVRKNDASALERKENSFANKRKPSNPLVPRDAKYAPSMPTPSTYACSMVFPLGKSLNVCMRIARRRALRVC